MAEKRMFSNRVIDSDAFCDMSFSAQALYFHLNLQADDDGIVNRAHKIQRAVGATQEDFDELVRNRFILIVDGVAIIKHWWMNNNLRSDRKQDTAYPEFFSKLKVKENGVYTLLQPTDNQTATTCQPSDNQVATNGQPTDNQATTNGQPTDNQATTNGQPSGAIDKYSIDKNSIDIFTLTARARACAYIEETEKEPEKDPEQPSAMELFEQFWKVYPYKVSRITAEQAWARLNPTPELAAEIIAGVNKHREKNESWRRDKGRYIPKPDTFLIDQRWRDELPEELPQSDKPITKPKPKPGSFGDFPQREYTEDSFAELERRKYAELMARGGGG